MFFFSLSFSTPPIPLGRFFCSSPESPHLNEQIWFLFSQETQGTSSVKSNKEPACGGFCRSSSVTSFSSCFTRLSMMRTTTAKATTTATAMNARRSPGRAAIPLSVALSFENTSGSERREQLPCVGPWCSERQQCSHRTPRQSSLRRSHRLRC